MPFLRYSPSGEVAERLVLPSEEEEIEGLSGQEQAERIAEVCAGYGGDVRFVTDVEADIAVLDRADRVAILRGKIGDDTATLAEVRELLRLERGL